MTIFDFDDAEALGRVQSVDTTTVIVRVDDIDKLRQMQVNRLVVLQSSRPGQHLVGIIQKITRSSAAAEDVDESIEDEELGLKAELNLVRISLIGTHADRRSDKRDVFLRTLESVPEIDANCFAVEGPRLTKFMRAISDVAEDGPRLALGAYTLDNKAEAFLNGNKFFQRHAVIVGSTGSGKSWSTARLLEQVAELANCNALVFDIHGEYTPLQGPGFRHLKIAGPADIDGKRGLTDNVVHLPYWLLGYEALLAFFGDHSEQSAANQSMVLSRAIVDAKTAYLEAGDHQDVLDNFTIDSPIPFELDAVLRDMSELNVARSEDGKRQGEFFGKLSRLIQRLENKRTDRRLGFLFGGGTETMAYDWLDKLVSLLLSGSKDQADAAGGVKIIDFSEVPSDILPLIVSLVARLAFSVQQWALDDKRHPIALFCDEAHLYIPERQSEGMADAISIGIFERIAKEGRKYGVGLVVISQRPSEVNRTVLSQCNNLIAMRLTNGDDQAVVKRLLPDSLGGFGELLPILDTAEALVVGDASLLPSRIRVTRPKNPPNSGTVPFWDCWAKDQTVGGLPQAVGSWRRQSQTAGAT